MTKEKIFEVIKHNLLGILPDLDPASIEPLQSMRDLGANSIDRADVVIQSMEELNLKFPLHELGAVENIQGLIDFFHTKYLGNNP
ncbi:MAG: acyl carrier protein [Kiritimatiellae bacterium]|nr:acyl carrier protein [Kiritimatiellia bacterium]DAC82030.1 TPA_exp: acyl carrier protein [Kiritimatiellota bacterium]